MNTTNGHRKVAINFEEVSSEAALAWLEQTNKNNRPVSEHVVQQYARDMREGRWLKESTTPIKFDTDGVLVDGQHRLWAVVESGVTGHFLVVRNADPRERQVQDIGLKRTVRHILSFEGKEASHMAIAVSNRMVVSFRAGYHPTSTEQRSYWLQNQEAVLWVLETFGTKQRGISQASILAPPARAYYTQDHEKLARFLDVLSSGITTDPKEVAALLLRNYVLTGHRVTRGVNRTGEVYGKAERALVAFLRGEEMTKLLACSEEQFPLPGEGQTVITRPAAATKTRAARKSKSTQ